MAASRHLGFFRAKKQVGLFSELYSTLFSACRSDAEKLPFPKPLFYLFSNGNQMEGHVVDYALPNFG
jgi:hypothetical protein